MYSYTFLHFFIYAHGCQRARACFTTDQMLHLMYSEFFCLKGFAAATMKHLCHGAVVMLLSVDQVPHVKLIFPSLPLSKYFVLFYGPVVLVGLNKCLLHQAWQCFSAYWRLCKVRFHGWLWLLLRCLRDRLINFSFILIFSFRSAISDFLDELKMFSAHVPALWWLLNKRSN